MLMPCFRIKSILKRKSIQAKAMPEFKNRDFLTSLASTSNKKPDFRKTGIALDTKLEETKLPPAHTPRMMQTLEYA